MMTSNTFATMPNAVFRHLEDGRLAAADSPITSVCLQLISIFRFWSTFLDLSLGKAKETNWLRFIAEKKNHTKKDGNH
jgi:hypothetical protein